jgi:DNA-binding MurR/RpiR family transcriptional regulator
MAIFSQTKFHPPPPPPDSPTPLSALRSHHGALPEAEARIAAAVLDDPVLVTSESVGDLAARAGTSTATVVRLCRRIGFDGFYRFKIELAHEVGMNRQFGHPEIGSSDRVSVVQSAMVADAREIADAVSMVQVEIFDAAVEAIVNATDVLFAGVGTSGPVAQLGALRFLVLGIHATAVQDVQAQDLAARLLRPGSACVLISHTGSSKETVAIAKSATAAGAATIAVTSFARSPLAKACDLVLSTGNRRDPRTLELFTSRAVHVSLLGALHAGVAARLPSKAGLLKAVSEVAGKHLY